MRVSLAGVDPVEPKRDEPEQYRQHRYENSNDDPSQYFSRRDSLSNSYCVKQKARIHPGSLNCWWTSCAARTLLAWWSFRGYSEPLDYHRTVLPAAPGGHEPAGVILAFNYNLADYRE